MDFKKLKELRRKKGLTQLELAEKVGCTRAWISTVELGKGNPTIDVLGKIAEALGTDIKKVI